MKHPEFRIQNSGDRIRKQIFRLLASGFWLLLCANGGRAQAPQEHPTDYQVKAVFLEKFGKFVEWPENAFADTNVALCIGVFGEDPFHGVLEKLAQNDIVKGRRVQVMQIKAMPDLKCCQVVFIPAAMKSQERDILAAIKKQGLPILTVGETDDFYQAGGMIEFVIENAQVHFRINNAAARDAGLKISSKLLTLSKS